MDFASASTTASTKKTTLSYTQMLQYYTGGTTYSSESVQFLAAVQRQLRSAFGLPWFNSGSPCSAPLNNGIANPDVQRILQLQPVPARAHLHSDRAVQLTLIVAEVAGLQRPVPVQPCQMNTPLWRFSVVEQPHSTSGLQHRRQQFQRLSGTLRRQTFRPPFTSTIGCGWSRPFASATSVSPDVSGSRDQLLRRRHFRLRVAAESDGDFPTLSHSSGSPADIINELRSTCWAEYQAERSPGAVRCDALLRRARRIHLGQRTIQPGNTYSAAWATFTIPTFRIAETAQDSR